MKHLEQQYGKVRHSGQYLSKRPNCLQLIHDIVFSPYLNGTRRFVMVLCYQVVSHHDPSGRPQRHPRFYFPDGNVIFLVRPLHLYQPPLGALNPWTKVEDVLFNVHRYFFQRDSSVFSAMFSLPKPEAEEHPEGEVDEKPIVLTSFSKKDFERFLMILYPM
jgi:hypothetical protein